MKQYTARYPEGYQPKIEYYQAKIAIATSRLEVHNIKFFTGKLEYFMAREAARQARLAQIID